jgi:hypothetical protein
MLMIGISFFQQLLFLVPILCIDIRRLELSDLHDQRVVNRVRRIPATLPAGTNADYTVIDQAHHGSALPATMYADEYGESRVRVVGISVRRYHTISIFFVSQNGVVCSRRKY